MSERNHAWVKLWGRKVCKHCGLHVEVVQIHNHLRIFRANWFDLRGKRYLKMPRCPGDQPLVLSAGG